MKTALTVSLLGSCVLAPAAAAQCNLGKVSALAGSASINFGASVAAAPGIVVIGAPLDDEGALDAGAAFVFEFDGTDFQQVQKLMPPAPAGSLDYFGDAVAADGQRLLIGSKDDELALNAGAGFLYQRTAQGWVLEDKLMASDGAIGDLFGYSVALEGDRAVLGTLGSDAAYVFELGPGGWTETAKLEAAGPEEVWDFGQSVDLSGDVIVVGASGSGTPGEGAVYVFHRIAGQWTQVQRLTETNPAALSTFGAHVAIDDDVIGVTARTFSFSGQGKAYAFEFQGGQWVETQMLQPHLPSAALFGSSVDVLDGRIAVGATDGSTFGSSATYAEVFERVAPGQWQFLAHAVAGEGGKDQYGTSLSLVPGGMFVGNPSASGPSGIFSGAAHRYALPDAAYLEASPEPVSLAAGNNQGLQISACDQPGAPYLIAGSLSGSAPGLTVGGVHVPLNLDGYSLALLAQPQLTLSQGVGLLDPEGQAQAAFHLPAVTDPAMVGAEVHHAALILDPAMGLMHASGAVSVRLIP